MSSNRSEWLPSPVRAPKPPLERMPFLSSNSLVSVIMPAYNTAEFIGAAIDSVLRQSYGNLELIVVDNGSVDKTREVIQSYTDHRIRTYEIPCRRIGGEPLEGIIAKSRNHGAVNAGGEFLAFLDSDDIWEPNKLELQLEHLADSSVSCIASNFAPVSPNSRFVNHLRFKPSVVFQDHSRHSILLENPVVLSSAVVRSKDFFATGMFDESPLFLANEDWDLWIRFSTLGRIRILSAPLVKYRVAFYSKRDSRKVAINSVEVIKKNADGSVPQKVIDAALSGCYATIGRAFLEHRDRAGIAYYLKGLRLARSARIRLRCLWGLALFAFPERPRRWFAMLAYRLNAYVQLARAHG
jgi:teichuronic acid biosynthesis glycosyltransferase TuaG